MFCLGTSLKIHHGRNHVLALMLHSHLSLMCLPDHHHHHHHHGCPFDHFQNHYTIFCHAASSLHHLHSPLSTDSEFWWVKRGAPTKTEAHNKLLHSTKFPMPLPPQINLSPEWHLSDSRTICCTLTYCKCYPLLKNKVLNYHKFAGQGTLSVNVPCNCLNVTIRFLINTVK